MLYTTWHRVITKSSAGQYNVSWIITMTYDSPGDKKSHVFTRQTKSIDKQWETQGLLNIYKLPQHHFHPI